MKQHRSAEEYIEYGCEDCDYRRDYKRDYGYHLFFLLMVFVISLLSTLTVSVIKIIYALG